jgi:hypothetical protein
MNHPFSDPDDAKLDSEAIAKTVKERISVGRPRFPWDRMNIEMGTMEELIEGMLERDPGHRWTVSVSHAVTDELDSPDLES